MTGMSRDKKTLLEPNTPPEPSQIPQIVHGSSDNSLDLEAKLRNQIRKWQSKLLDLGNRNSLINCSFNPTRGVIELVFPETEAIWRKLATDGTAGSNAMRFPWRHELVPPPPGYDDEEETTTSEVEPVKKKKEWHPSLDECRASRKQGDRDLLTGVGDKALERRLRTLDGHAHLSLSEQGVHCLYVAFGFLKWFEAVDSDVEHLSPLMLVPVTLSRTSADAPWELTEAEDDAIDNLCLRERLKQDFGMLLPVLPDIGELEEDGARHRFLAAVRAAVASNERWEVQDRCALGRFAFPKVAMWQDLGDHVDSVLTNALCRSVGGDPTIPPQRSFGISAPLPEAATLDDEIVPGEIKTILDCDSSQLEAIIAARRGVSFVLDGPPGTGKSQTIANIIADALSAGRRVLFVSEKVSALDVVKRRLDDCGLGDFCLECHSSKANRKAVLEELKWCLDLPAEVYDDTTPKLEEAKHRRSRLNDYVRTIHRRRPPLGISPYELFGHVSRFHRLGHSIKSRCELPDVTGMDRSQFDEWLQLLDRSKDSADVIRQHDQHPWRGCQLTARPLTLSDDIQHHLSVLSQAFSTMSQAVLPLIHAALIPDEPTPATLNEFTKSLRESLTAPQIPASWFAAPQEVAATVLRRYHANCEHERHRSDLAGFIDEVETNFPDDQLEGIESTPERTVWLERLHGTLPESARKQHEFLNEPLQLLRTLLECLESASADAAHLIGQLPVPVRTELSIAKFPAVVALARLIAKVFPLRPEWLVAEHWPRLRHASQTSLESLEAASLIAKRLEVRIPTQQFIEFSQAIESPELLQVAWDAVREVAPEGNSEVLSSLYQKLHAGIDALTGLQFTVQEVLGSLGDERGAPPSLQLSQSLETVIPLMINAEVLPGQWRDAGVRVRIRSVCDEAISDLKEATELRQQLDERLSHRAFKAAAAPLAERAPAFQSFWTRLFGKFKSYRQEVSDLFKSELPATPLMLADLTRLRIWHRRIGEALEGANTLANYLPQPFAADELTSWTGLRETLQTFERLATEAPDVVARLPGRSIPIDRPVIEAAAGKLKIQRDALNSSLAGSPFESMIEKELSLDDLINRLTRLSESIALCQSAGAAVAPHYVLIPKTLPTLMEDLRLAGQYSRHYGEVSAQFRPLTDLLPADASPTDTVMWKRVQDGVHAAEQLGKVTKSLETHRDALCQEGRLDPQTLIASADKLETTHQKLMAALQIADSRLRLFPAELSLGELTKLPIAGLLSAANEALPIFVTRFESLTALVRVMRPDSDIEIESLPDARLSVAGARRAREERLACDSALISMGVDPDHGLSDGGSAESEWLLERTAEGPIAPLMQAVASQPDIRLQVAQAVEAIQAASSSDFPSSFKFLRTLFSLQAVTGRGISIAQMPIGTLGEYLGGLQNAMGALDEWLRFSRWQRDMHEQGFDGVVEELLAGRFPPDETKSVIAARYFRQVFDQLAEEDRLLGEFDLEAHEQSRERFRKLDEWEVRSAGSRIRQYQLGRDDRPRSGWFTEATSELGILLKETQKKRRQLPLRKLFAEIPSVLQRLKPCIMMSPLSVSTFLQSDEIRFDLVIFDEASQVFPWDAIGAIYRGTQLIVAGDEKQLPPTNFFNRADLESDNEDEEDIGDYESILSLCKSIGMPGRGLRWHYRSRREPLIAFSNRHFYSGDLVTFPSIRDATSDAVRLEFVPQGRWIDRTNRPEAERVTDLVVRHLRSRPETSLGIIAFNQSQQAAIADSIYERRRKYPEVEALFHTGLTEPLFVKNLENVQGDERDCIILSMGYGYNDAGKFLKNFGPLTKAGGERRLNVAVTRAREEVVLVASVKAADLDLSGSTSQGAHLLKGYLEYAERGVDSLAREITSITGEAESTFEEEVATALLQHGLHPISQVGCGGFRIDLALKHPQRPGEFCLGIECDGATYHSSKTARDRDRIRQNVLENLGWQIIRVWSTDWIRNPQRQLDRILAAYAGIVTPASPHPGNEPAVDDDLEDLQPHIVEQLVTPRSYFKTIKDVPEDHLQHTFHSIVRRGGAIDLDGLIQLTARELGFARIGNKIRERLETTLNKQLELGHLRWVGDRIAAQSEV